VVTLQFVRDRKGSETAESGQVMVGGLEGDREEVLGNDIDGVVGADDEDEDGRQYG